MSWTKASSGPTIFFAPIHLLQHYVMSMCVLELELGSACWMETAFIVASMPCDLRNASAFVCKGFYAILV